MRRIVFPRVWPARSYGFRTLPTTLEPVDDAGAQGRPLGGPSAGGWDTGTASSAQIIDRDANSPGRSFLGRTEDALNSGPAPDMIDRGTTARIGGKIAVGAGPSGLVGWPYDGNELMVPHIAIPRRPITVTPFARTIDTGVTIPSSPIGDPVT